MPQNPVYQSKTQAGVYGPFLLDTAGDLSVGTGVSSKLNITAPVVVKVGAGRVGTVIAVVGTGAVTICDCATTGAAVTANTIFAIAATTVGAIYKLDMPFTTGLVVSAVTGQLTISYT